MRSFLRDERQELTSELSICAEATSIISIKFEGDFVDTLVCGKCTVEIKTIDSAGKLRY